MLYIQLYGASIGINLAGNTNMIIYSPPEADYLSIEAAKFYNILIVTAIPIYIVLITNDNSNEGS